MSYLSMTPEAFAHCIDAKRDEALVTLLFEIGHRRLDYAELAWDWKPEGMSRYVVETRKWKALKYFEHAATVGAPAFSQLTLRGQEFVLQSMGEAAHIHYFEGCDESEEIAKVHWQNTAALGESVFCELTLIGRTYVLTSLFNCAGHSSWSTKEALALHARAIVLRTNELRIQFSFAVTQ